MVAREFEPHTNGASVVQAHRVTEDTAGNVVLVDGSSRRVGPGDVLVQTQNANRYDVVPDKEFTKDYSPGTDLWVDEDNETFEPADHSAAEVRNYLHRSDVDDEEKERVREAERNGRNRESAFR